MLQSISVTVLQKCITRKALNGSYIVHFGVLNGDYANESALLSIFQMLWSTHNSSESSIICSLHVSAYFG